MYICTVTPRATKGVYDGYLQGFPDGSRSPDGDP